MKSRCRSRRLSYCGTCKTIGREYGHRFRLLLNHDTVFLGEVLMALSPIKIEDPAYRARNCMTLPADLPLPLRYAAAANVVLSQFKAEDHAADTGARLWRLASRVLSPAYRKASAQLKAWSFPLEAVSAPLRRQSEIERGPASLEAFAAPTANATALFFNHGTALIGRPDLGVAMHNFGYGFGRLVYLLDAFEDFERDVREGTFNALAALGLDVKWAKRELRSIGSELNAILAGLPAAPDRIREFQARLRSNLESRLEPGLPIFMSKRDKSAPAAGEAGSKSSGKSSCCDGCDACNCCVFDSCCESMSCCDGCGSCCVCGSCCECGSCDC